MLPNNQNLFSIFVIVTVSLPCFETVCCPGPYHGYKVQYGVHTSICNKTLQNTSTIIDLQR